MADVESVSWLRSPSSGAKMAPVTAITAPNQAASRKGKREAGNESEMESNEENRLQHCNIAMLANNKLKNETSESDLIPTLRLRLEELETATGASRSKSPNRRSRQAITKPRHKQPTAKGSATTTATATPTETFAAELTTKTSQESLQLQLHRLTFDDWLLLKEKQDALRRRDDRRELQRLSHMQAMRQQLSDKCYADWLRSKRRRGSNSNSNNNSSSSSRSLLEAARRRAELSERSVQQWERRKLLELQRQRERQKRERHEQQLRDQLRRQLSQLAWQRWLQQLDRQQQQQQQQQQQRLKQSHHRAMNSASSTPLSLSLSLQRRAAIESRYLHVPLSVAQRSLRQRLDSLDGRHMQRQRRQY